MNTESTVNENMEQWHYPSKGELPGKGQRILFLLKEPSEIGEGREKLMDMLFALFGVILEGIVLAIYGRLRKRKEREKFYQCLDRMLMDEQNREELRKHGI